MTVALEPSVVREIEEACARLIVDYTHFVDHGRAAEIAGQFTDDGVWESDDARYEGGAAIRKAFQARQDQTARTSRHVCTNIAVRVIDHDSAEGLTYLTLYRSDDELDNGAAPLRGPLLVGEYRDRFVRTPGGWRFAHRRIDVAFRPRKTTDAG